MLLNDNWSLTWEPLSCGPDEALRIQDKASDWLNADLPCDIHMPLIAQGIIAEPLDADHCFASEWTEQKSWWFRKRFQLPAERLACNTIELAFESLDAEADVWLNGIYLGHHRSAFYPMVRKVKPMLRPGENTLLVRVTSGIERYADSDIALTGDSVTILTGDGIGARGDARRVMVRKPQYVYGWDWCPRLTSCGIMGDVRLDFQDGPQIRHVHAVTKSVQAGQVQGSGDARLLVKVEAENLHPFQTVDAELCIELRYNGALVSTVQAEHCLRSGLNYIQHEIELAQAKLWWPHGMGEQPLYTVSARLAAGGHVNTYPDFAIGIRTIRLNTDKLPGEETDGERTFALEVNGVPLFAKGANWIPADSIYARVTDARYDTLISEAKAANFNMLRVWGGGLYERERFYGNCDRLGLLVWQDFMFACAKYPDHLPWFREEVEQEMDYQTKRLRNHSSLALWCGNNENHWAFDEGWNESSNPSFYGGAICSNELAPRIVERNCPEIPYWNSSPYGGEHPNGSLQGDRHHWHDCTMSPDMDKRITPEEYDKITSPFISEYGYIGPCRRSSIEAYHAGRPLDRNGAVWRLHNNTFEKETVAAGIEKHYCQAASLDIDKYLHYAGLVQGLMYGYSLESLRASLKCNGALFWMYNDCWGEVGWSIIDYYLARKIAYYSVKRAFEPVKLVLRQSGGVVRLTAINETAAPVTCRILYGLARYDGAAVAAGAGQDGEFQLHLPPHTRLVAREWELPAHDARQAFVYARPAVPDTPIRPAVLRELPFREIEAPRARLTLSELREDESFLRFRVSTDTYAHAVQFGLDERIALSDEYFDLLPGEYRDIAIQKDAASLDASSITPSSVSVSGFGSV